jgi:hypothetical protein
LVETKEHNEASSFGEYPCDIALMLINIANGTGFWKKRKNIVADIQPIGCTLLSTFMPAACRC